MSDLTLGPVVGKIGGAAIIDEFEGEQTNTLAFDLPEGRWVVLIYVGRASSLVNSNILFDGTTVLVTHSSMPRGTAAVRGVTGGSHTVGKTSSGDSTIYRVSYFPDPTP